jgi:hypothetical protein
LSKAGAGNILKRALRAENVEHSFAANPATTALSDAERLLRRFAEKKR